MVLRIFGNSYRRLYRKIDRGERVERGRERERESRAREREREREKRKERERAIERERERGSQQSSIRRLRRQLRPGMRKVRLQKVGIYS